MESEQTLKDLIGKKIESLFVNDDQSILVFKTDKGDYGYKTRGDCCSETWFADITGVKSLLGFTVISTEDIGISLPQDSRCRQEEDEFYGLKLITSEGITDIIYRNSSNGHYGGSCDQMTRLPDISTFEKITSDWQANQTND